MDIVKDFEEQKPYAWIYSLDQEILEEGFRIKTSEIGGVFAHAKAKPEIDAIVNDFPGLFEPITVIRYVRQGNSKKKRGKKKRKKKVSQKQPLRRVKEMYITLNSDNIRYITYPTDKEVLERGGHGRSDLISIIRNLAEDGDYDLPTVNQKGDEERKRVNELLRQGLKEAQRLYKKERTQKVLRGEQPSLGVSYFQRPSSKVYMGRRKYQKS